MNAPFQLPVAAAPVSLLSSRAMLVRVSVTQWTARKIDKGATDSVNRDHGAAHDAGRYNKALVAREALAGIVSAANEARGFHYARTLPWLDDGARILPATGYQAYSDGMHDIRLRFETAVEAFEANYTQYVEAARLRLGSLFKPSDYPDVSEVRAKFTFSTRVLPLPDAADFRADMPADAVAAIRAELANDGRAALDAAMRDAWGRVVETVGKLAQKLVEYRPATEIEKATGIFRDSLVENVRELADILPTFNLTGDVFMSDVVERIRAELCGRTAAELRDDEAARRETAACAAQILDDVSAYMA